MNWKIAMIMLLCFGGIAIGGAIIAYLRWIWGGPGMVLGAGLFLLVVALAIGRIAYLDEHRKRL